MNIQAISQKLTANSIKHTITKGLLYVTKKNGRKATYHLNQVSEESLTKWLSLKTKPQLVLTMAEMPAKQRQIKMF